ncbi:uncharacterized protein with ParB-like and HNH nuclease domain [Treponema rectale]|uniref:Uncharacterized protein with ParB-like and HNH nuclease domain n=1 Tax=Treponema rectale TaxID=744512 RepID=A0A840SK29_9SPIR|nr:DUF262 domain-containing protein [Treponema rectale]MBB5219823.1 uncharacterized protein with ParB-like and HNH nuclease domain [Treponema rectale]
MIAKGESLYFLVDKEDDAIQVPYFQRPYIWNLENWSDLLSDLLNNNGKHFLGSIILKKTLKPGTNETDTTIIDGQQRLTTLSILIKVMYDYLKDSEYWDTSDDSIAINSLFYKKIYNDIEIKYNLLLNHSHLDGEAYSKVIGSVEKNGKQLIITAPLQNEIKQELQKEKILYEEAIANGKKIKEISKYDKELIRNCYKFFYKQLADINLIDLKKLWLSLFEQKENKNNILVRIVIDDSEQEQEIFDTINSAGIPLSPTDIIKNKIYQQLKECDMPYDKVYEYYKSTWEETFEKDEDTRKWWHTQKNIGRYKRDNIELLLHSVAICIGIFSTEDEVITNLAKVYKTAINKFTSVKEIKKLIDIIISYANIYKNIMPQFNPTEPIKFIEVRKRLSCILNVSETSTFTPYILYLYNIYYGKNDDLLDKRLCMVEKIIMHYLISGESNKNFNKYCYQFVKKEQVGDEKNLLEYVMSEPDKFFTNIKLKEGLAEVNPKLGKLFLFMIQLHRYAKLDPKEDDYNKGLEFEKERELEHILPQKWYKDEDWINQRVIGNGDEKPEEYRKYCVSSLGNMTLIKKGLNSTISNKIFEKKYKGDIGKNNGMSNYISLSISKEIINYCHNFVWTEESIKKRENDLGNELIEIWGCDK